MRSRADGRPPALAWVATSIPPECYSRSPGIRLPPHSVSRMTTIGLLHPGGMGAALGACLRARGHDVLWVAAGRGAATRERADAAGLRDAGSLAALRDRS